DATYEPMQFGDFYGPRLKRLATMRLRELRRHVKFKAGPASTPEVKQRVANRLRERSQPGDARAADVIERYIKS
ncbi:MAG TPA: hypothetical protein VIO84_07925, partial [Candidatus Dormibacteraeota bacterium]